MRANEDTDWTNPDTAAESAITERPAAPQFWRCDGEDFEPAAFRTLTEATGDKPATPEAIVAGGGELLAESAQDVAQWSFTEAGMRRLDAEMAQSADSDRDVVLGVLLASDFSLDMVGQ